MQYFPPPTLYVWLAYAGSVLAFFATVKFYNSRLHGMFDTTECVEQEDEDDSNAADRRGRPRPLGKNALNAAAAAAAASVEEGYEMKEMTRRDASEAHTAALASAVEGQVAGEAGSSSRASLADGAVAAAICALGADGDGGVIPAELIRDRVARETNRPDRRSSTFGKAASI